jgi:hypothetical protein
LERRGQYAFQADIQKLVVLVATQAGSIIAGLTRTSEGGRLIAES